MKDQLTEALKAIKDKGGKARQAAIKAEIMTDAAEAVSNGELWRIEIIATITKERMLAASRPKLKEGGILEGR